MFTTEDFGIMSEDIQKLILERLAADGSKKENVNMLSELQDVLPDLTGEDYQLA